MQCLVDLYWFQHYQTASILSAKSVVPQAFSRQKATKFLRPFDTSLPSFLIVHNSFPLSPGRKLILCGISAGSVSSVAWAQTSR